MAPTGLPRGFQELCVGIRWSPSKQFCIAQIMIINKLEYTSTAPSLAHSSYSRSPPPPPPPPLPLHFHRPLLVPSSSLLHPSQPLSHPYASPPSPPYTPPSPNYPSLAIAFSHFPLHPYICLRVRIPIIPPLPNPFATVYEQKVILWTNFTLFTSNSVHISIALLLHCA